MICSGKFIKIEPCEIISDKVLAIFIAATITDCWVKCKHTSNCETVASKTAESGEIAHSKKQITCYLLKTNEITEVNNTAAAPQINRMGSLVNRMGSLVNRMGSLVNRMGSLVSRFLGNS